ncbi:16S rRNA (uracil(1498)-N(3))-methyltransferase [Buchnera aphidicola (Hyadaphis tataricae)]|uniref:Ribosomal RNA small subunit methyltransferase E n=1 Tax=Buchnera aphidicola (Hyadaphis tataricae) TaxID=1241859 RepID=A0A4D6XZS0_9GAMM|nr:16S rRNA (uracil(1498)-N(3))-methyltransferase [Buchnera aphidicola]QCI21699.1 16S rRNA (uracil(1498)-N(3))-methyltransferase [Buchnera aphidicola (Hyadaphis tataricae)]
MCIKNALIQNSNYNNLNNLPRIYMQENLIISQYYYLSKNNTHYLKKVLRMQNKHIIEIFNNTNYVFFAQIINFFKATMTVQIVEKKEKNIESLINIHLGQVMTKYDKIDFIIQKSVEMGITTITPLFSEYCNIQKKFFNVKHKIERWKKIIISSCQQCHRNIIPNINHPKDIFSWCQENEKNETKIVFDPTSDLNICHFKKPKKNFRIIIGSEGGFSKYEMEKIIEYGFIPIRLGSRILRTETATLAAITVLQTKFGDFATF